MARCERVNLTVVMYRSHPVASPLRPCLLSSSPFFSSLLLSLWRAQFITGSLLNFGAFTFASASILVPIEAVQFVVNVGFNKLVNEKPISCRMLSGVTLTICGTVLCVVFGPTDERCFGVNDLVGLDQAAWWVYLVASLGLATAAHMVHESYARAVASGHRPKYAVYVMPISFSVSSALFGGSQMIVHSKAVAELFELQVQMVEPIPLAHWFFWLELVLLSTTGIYWMLRMNTSLGLYDPLFIIPLLQSSYILFGVISGGIYFEEFAGLHNGPAGAGAWPLFIFGMIGVLSGLALIAPPPSEAGLPTTAAPGPKLREHRISREDLEGGCGSAAASSSTRKPSASPRARTSPCASFVRHGETYEAACTDSAGGTSGIALSRLPESRTPLSAQGIMAPRTTTRRLRVRSRTRRMAAAVAPRAATRRTRARGGARHWGGLGRHTGRGAFRSARHADQGGRHGQRGRTHGGGRSWCSRQRGW